MDTNTAILALASAGASDLAGAVMFYLFGAMAVGSAIGVLVSRNIVRTAVCLLMALLGVAGLYLGMRAEFLAAVQLVVYAGGTLVLIIFGVMLTNNSTFQLYRVNRTEMVVGVGLVALLAAALVTAILHGGMGGRVVAEGNAYPIQSLGEALLGDYLVPFELISVLLLAVMIGAAYLAKGRRRDGEGQ
jgi:NADH-quinone oxidoreductase subunit J